MQERNTPLWKDMLDIVSGLVIVCIAFLTIFMLMPLLPVEVFVFTRFDNANDFFFIDWTPEHIICISVLNIIMNSEAI